MSPAAALTVAGRKGDEAGEDHRRRPASAQPRSRQAAAAITAAAPMSVRCVPISGMVTRAGRKVPTRLPAVDSAKMRPAVDPAFSTSADADADGERGHRAEQQHRGHEQEDAGEGAEDRAGRDRVDAVDGHVEERPGDERDDGGEDGAGQNEYPQQPLASASGRPAGRRGRIRATARPGSDR